MQKFTIKELARDLLQAFSVADIDPAKDTIVSAMAKFQDKGLRHLILYVEDGGCLCLCSDPEMSRRIRKAIEAIDAELDLLEMNNKPDIDEAI